MGLNREVFQRRPGRLKGASGVSAFCGIVDLPLRRNQSTLGAWSRLRLVAEPKPARRFKHARSGSESIVQVICTRRGPILLDELAIASRARSKLDARIARSAGPAESMPLSAVSRFG